MFFDDISRTRRAARRVATGLALAAAVLAASVPASAAGLLVADGGFGGVLEIEEHSVHVTLANGIAVTQVDQVFRNTENRVVEALYTFPVPEKASVANFSMWIGGVEMVGEVVEKKRAREIYESYKQTRRDPGLLEQVDFKTFEMRIFPIPAQAEQHVQITYYQELDFDHDQASYVYPLATVTRTDIDGRVSGRFAFDLDVLSPIPIVKLESPSHGGDMLVVEHDDNNYQASLETSGGDLRRDLVVQLDVSRPVTGLDMVTSRQPGEDGFFQLTLTAGDELEGRTKGMDYVFVLDISGSMGNDGKLGTSSDAIGAFLTSLEDDDRFEVVTFNIAPDTLFDRLRAADSAGRGQALDFLRSQRANGGTSLQPALDVAYRYHDPDRVLNVVILSDGMTEQDERRTLLRSVAQRPPGTRVFCIGVGNEVNRPLLQQIAEDAGGLADFVSQGEDFERRASAFRRKLIRPAIADLQLAINDIGAYDIEPQELPDLFHGSPIRIYGRYRGSGSGNLTFRGDIAGRGFEKVAQVEFPKTDDSSPEIERMWASHRIAGLLRQADSKGGRQSVIDEVVRLGEGFSIVTEYTSFLVLENDAEYERWSIARRNALRMERDRGQQQRLRAEIERGRQASRSALGPMDPPLQLIKIAAAQQPDMDFGRPPGGQPEQWTQPNAEPTMAPPRPNGPSAAPTRAERRQSVDFGGGGALDGLTVTLMVLMSGVAWWLGPGTRLGKGRS